MDNTGAILRRSEKLLAICDCNNFFVSCERLFRPDLEGVPVVVLSSNDGVVISRSNEVKALGVKMGEPYFRVRPFLKSRGTTVFSANFHLYEEISARVMAVLKRCAPVMEVYSIDEAFLELPPAGRESPASWGRSLRRMVLRETGIPLSVGVAATKTLAKLAVERGKKDPRLEGAMALLPEDEPGGFLDSFPVGDVWGVGRRWGRLLEGKGLSTARRLRDADDEWIGKHMGIRGLRTVWELRGVRCFAVEERERPPQSIRSSRSFASSIRDMESLSEAVEEFTLTAGRRLREQRSMAGVLTVGIFTSRFREPFYGRRVKIPLGRPTDSDGRLIGAALKGLAAIYRRGYAYDKAEVTLEELSSASMIQMGLFDRPDDRSGILSRIADRINRETGRQILRPGALTGEGAWRPRRDRHSGIRIEDLDGIPSVPALR